MKGEKSVHPKADALFINKLNKIKVLGLIRETGPVSRADIVKRTGLSAPTVTRIVDGLIHDEKLVAEVGMGSSSGGRPPLLVKFNSEQNYVIGIDLGATFTRGALSNLDGKFINEIKIPTKLESGFDAIMEDLSDLIHRLSNGNSKVKKQRIFGVGIAVAGLINRRKNLVEYSPDFDWYNVDIANALGKSIEFPVIFDNVTRLMALGGLSYGAGQKLQNFICVNVGYGIGAGIIVDGKLLMGADGFAGEFGHITVETDSDIQCSCKKYGCLEALASGKAIALIARSRIARGQSSLLVELCGGDVNKITAKMVADATRKGDELASNVFNRAMDYIGIGISSLVNIFNPELVTIGGGVSLAGDIFFDNIRKSVDRNIMQPTSREVEILPVTFGENAALMGAFALILQRVLNLDI
ncbi:MAG: ROK family transcriptional regulator [Bacteroidales bacterium]